MLSPHRCQRLPSRYPLPNRLQRRGAIVPLFAVCLAFLLTLVALAVDIGGLLVARTQLQSSADAAAMAGAWELLEQKQAQRTPAVQSQKTRQTAVRYAALNRVCTMPPKVDVNAANQPGGDLVLGYVANPLSRSSPMTFANAGQYNAVRVRVRQPAPLFFARALGLQDEPAEAEATAAFLVSFRGFRVTEKEPTLRVLPFTLKKTLWDSVLDGHGDDAWAWDDAAKRVASGSDGAAEINLYPFDTGSGGNSGTVDIGGTQSSTPKIVRQITQGVTEDDLRYHGGKLSLDDRGELRLSADPGLKIGPIQRALTSVLGSPFIIPLYRDVTGNGQKAEYTIVAFAAIRLLDVELTGGDKRVIVQPAHMTTRGGIPDGGQGSSTGIYSPVRLMQ